MVDEMEPGFLPGWLKLMFACFSLDYKLVFMLKCKPANCPREFHPKLLLYKTHEQAAGSLVLPW